MHQVRAALDNAVDAVAVAHGAMHLDRQRKFPISVTRAAYEGTGTRRGQRDTALAGVPETYRRVVDDAQPFHNRSRAKAHPLAVLAQFNNTDKHQRAHRAYPVVHGVGVNVTVNGVPHVTYTPYTGASHVTKDGPLQIKLAPPPPLVSTELTGLRVGIAFGVKGWQIPDLARTVDFADDLLRRIALVRLPVGASDSTESPTSTG